MIWSHHIYKKPINVGYYTEIRKWSPEADIFSCSERQNCTICRQSTAGNSWAGLTVIWCPKVAANEREKCFLLENICNLATELWAIDHTAPRLKSLGWPQSNGCGNSPIRFNNLLTCCVNNKSIFKRIFIFKKNYFQENFGQLTEVEMASDAHV